MASDVRYSFEDALLLSVMSAPAGWLSHPNRGPRPSTQHAPHGHGAHHFEPRPNCFKHDPQWLCKNGQLQKGENQGTRGLGS